MLTILAFGESDRYLAAAAAGHQRIGLSGTLERELVSDQIPGMNAPAYQMLDQIHHPLRGGDPGAVNALLTVHQIRAWSKRHGVSFADESNFAPLSCCTDSRLAASV